MGNIRDWCGQQIETNTRDVLERLIGGALDWKRIALTEEQVDDPRYRLRRWIISKADRRYKPVRYYDANVGSLLPDSGNL